MGGRYVDAEPLPQAHVYVALGSCGYIRTGWHTRIAGEAFPTIFSLGIEGLGERTPPGSGLLCMAIVGGAIISLLTGAIADATSLAMALAIPANCYLLIAIYGWSARHPA